MRGTRGAVRTICRRHGTGLVESLVGVWFCHQCRREDHWEFMRHQRATVDTRAQQLAQTTTVDDEERRHAR